MKLSFILFCHVKLLQASEKSAQAKKWAEPHVETAKMVPSLDPCILLNYCLSCTDNIIFVLEEIGSCQGKIGHAQEKCRTLPGEGVNKISGGL
jgi:hypothetical protein